MPHSKLNTSERELVFKAPLLVCILIAGADGNIDKKEIKEAIHMAEDQHWVRSNLLEFFQDMAADFEDKLMVLLQSYPFDSKRRNQIIQTELAQLNLIWPKMDGNFAQSYYEMLLHLSRRIASSSGSIWGRIASEEARLLELPMIEKPVKS